MEDEEKRKTKKSRDPTDAEDQRRKKNLYERNSIYDDDESNTSRRTREKKKTDIIYMKSNPYILYIDWKEWDLLHPVPIKHNFWMLHPNIIIWAMRTWIIVDHSVAVPYRWHQTG